MSNIINFYKTNQLYGYFSNFSKHPIYLRGKTWATSEHYYQAQKFAGTENEEVIRLCKKAMEAAVLGNKLPLRDDWEQVKDDEMRLALYAKFTQHPDLKQCLLATGDAVLVEHTKNDSYWGDGGDGSGKNMLGKLLMELRDNLK